MATGATCEFCDDEATPRTPYCKRCGSGLSRWDLRIRREGRQVAETWATRVGLFSRRMAFVLEQHPKKKTNVHRLAARRKKAAATKTAGSKAA